jgi:magnesium chelatase subunit D
MEAARRALLLLAIDPGLKGLLISGGPGSAKSRLARSFRAITHANDRAPAPFVELPLNATADQLLGGLDLESTLAAGERRASRGALSRADGGALYVDGVNLLDAGLADGIAAALEDGVLRLERDGISESLEARFVFLGTSDPTEGEVSANLRDRVGLLVETACDGSAAENANIIERALEFDKDPASLIEAFAVESASIKDQIEEARRRLSGIAIGRGDIGRIAEIAMRLGVEGNRADIFAVRAARASAALAGHKTVTDPDIVTAIKLVLLPRATTVPEPAPAHSESREARSDEQEMRGPEPLSSERADPADPRQTSIDELMIEAIGSPAPDQTLTLETIGKRRAQAGGSGKRARAADSIRGRYTGAVRFRREGFRVAMDATLRASAPHQVARRANRTSESSDLTSIQSSDVAVRESRIKIRPDDLRFKRFKRRLGALFIFAVDASGSMAVNRMAQAKGAITRLLGEAYLQRDKVALISFRGSQADVLLAPTRSVELAKRLVDAMPAGGATPLAAGLERALEVVRVARLQGMERAVILLMTDGRANIGLCGHRREGANRAAVQHELREIGAVLKTAGVQSVVIDTRLSFVSAGDARGLADDLGARYFYLPRADAATFYAAVSEIAATSWR